MSLEDYTHPPCSSCGAHDELEESMKRSEKQNATQHNEILMKLDKAIINITWIRIIGKWALATMIGYYAAVGYHIFSRDYASKEDVYEIKEIIDEGEVLHYQNEKEIAGMNAKLEILVEHARKVDNK